MESKWIGDSTNGIELRPNADGTLDEVCVYIDGASVAHLEHMTDTSFSLGFYVKEYTANIRVFSKGRGSRIEAKRMKGD